MKILKNGMYLLLVLLLSTTISCNEDEVINNNIGGLDFVIATLNADGNKVGVVATTVPGDNRTLYTVDFGSTADDDTDVFETSGPMVSFDYPKESATYMLTVTASFPGQNDVSISKEHTVTIVEPAPTGDGLTGVWKLAPEAGAIGVGPAQDNVSWWSNTTDDIATRSCLFDDEYVFGADGSFQNVVGTSTWVEAWQGTDPENCGAPVAPHDGTATDATYEYNGSTVTINGTGAFLGLAKVINGAEISSPADAADSITYIAALSEDGNSLELDIEVAGGGHWSFKLVKDVVPVGVEGTWKLSPVSGALGVGPALNNVSWWSSTTDDVATRACLFDDEYVFGADGSFQNILGAQTWVEAWQGTDPENCGAPVAPHDGTATATYSYDEAAGTITINGTGAYLGLAKVINGAEISSPADAADSITYIAALSADGLTLDIDIEVAGGGHWSFKLARQ